MGVCIFHDWERIGEIKPLVNENSEFSYGGYIGHFALARCRKCGKEKLKAHHSGRIRRWYSYDEMTKAEYMGDDAVSRRYDRDKEVS